MFTLKITKNKP